MQPFGAVGTGGDPDVHEGVLELSTGSVVDGTVVGWGLGVTVMGFGASVVPPMMVVVPPFVSVCVGMASVRPPQTTTRPELVVVSVAPMMDVVPFATLDMNTNGQDMEEEERGWIHTA